VLSIEEENGTGVFGFEEYFRKNPKHFECPLITLPHGNKILVPLAGIARGPLGECL
jgi:hypothetical protein